MRVSEHDHPPLTALFKALYTQMHTPHQKTALIIGGSGFIASYIIAALKGAGWRIKLTTRQTRLNDESVQCDLNQMTQVADWLPVLNGVDAVINVAGILRETRAQKFTTIHYTAPLALAHACLEKQVAHFVQISALGAPEDGEFIASKHRFDEALLKLPLIAHVLRPSVVYSATGSYGGTSLLRALAGIPYCQILPGHGQWQLQAIAAEDVALAVVRALEKNHSALLELGGPETLSFAEYQAAWRRWLQTPTYLTLNIPIALVDLGVKLGEKLGRGPMGETMWRMLKRGNRCETGAYQAVQDNLQMDAISLNTALAQRPSQVQDRWQAQLYFLAPALTISIALLWLLSAALGFFTPASDIEQMTATTLLKGSLGVGLARAGAVIDLGLGLLLLLQWRPRLVIAGMLGSVLSYTLIFSLLIPELWLDPIGGLAKNLVLLPALAVCWVLTKRR